MYIVLGIDIFGSNVVRYKNITKIMIMCLS